MNYRNYQVARNASWQILLDLKIDRLPISVSDVCLALGIELRSIAQMMPRVHERNQQGRQVVDGIARYVGQRAVVLYNDLARPARCRFTVAHEVGHFVLGHVEHAPQGIIETPVLFRQGGAPVSAEEAAANVFAARLLSPACVMWGLGVNRAEQIQQLCDISKEAAEYRMKRMETLYAREREFLETRGRSCFLLSKQEQAVYQQFAPYIEANRL